MKKKYFLQKIIILYLILISSSFSAKSSYFEKGKMLFDKKSFEKSKIYFERDIVFNPKSERSYLYLAKIFKKNDNDQELEINLTNVLLLNPQNDEAIYLLVLLKIKESDYNEAKILIEKFNLVCKEFCSKKPEILEKFNKLTPENAKDKN